MARVTCAAFLLAASMAVFAARLPAAEGEKSEAAAKAAEAFESLYGKDWKRVKSTADVRDDIELARKLLAAAKEAKDQPEFLAVLCEKACELATNPMGYATAADALELEAAGVPEKASAVAARLLEIRQKQFDASKGDERAAAGEALLALLLPMADARENAKDAIGAAALLRRALVVAAAAKSDRRTEIEARLKTLEQALRTAREIEDMKKLLEADPTKAAVRERLVKLYLVDLDDPAEAAKWVQGVEDASLGKHVPGAAKPVADAPEYACLELGEWYRGLGETAPPAAKAAMFARAQAYYNRFLDLHTAADLDRTKAKTAVQKIETDLSKGPVAPATPTKQPKETTKEGKWIDLLALVDPAKDGVRGDWRRDKGALQAESSFGQSAEIMIPMIPQGSYELEAKFVRTKELPFCMTSLILPVGSTCVGLNLGARWDNGSPIGHGLENIKGKDWWETEVAVKTGQIELGVEHTVSVKVRPGESEARVTVVLDGKPIIDWRGPPSALSAGQDWRLPKPECLGLAVKSSGAAWRSVQLKMLSGEAKPLRPGGSSGVPEKPAAAEKPAAKAKPGAWIDVLPMVDLSKDKVRGEWQRTPTGLEARSPDGAARVVVPVAPAGSYELEFRFSCDGGASGCNAVLPVGDKSVLLILARAQDGTSGIAYIGGKFQDKNESAAKLGGLAVDRLYTAIAKVVVDGDKAEISATLDGKPCVSWKGPLSALTLPAEWWWLPDAKCPGLGMDWGRLAIQGIRLRMLSGEAKPLRASVQPIGKP